MPDFSQKPFLKFSRNQDFVVLWLAFGLLTFLRYQTAEIWQQIFLVLYAVLAFAAGMKGAFWSGLAFAGLGWLFSLGVRPGGLLIPASVVPASIANVLVQGVFLVVCLFLGWGCCQIRSLKGQYRSLWMEYREILQNFENSKDELRELYFAAVNSLAATLEARDEGSLGHLERVASYAVALGRELGLSSEELTEIYYASVLHDLGKIGISEVILNKPDRLTREEYAEIRRHPEIGTGILQSLTFTKNLLPLILHHHERYDGTGYPMGLAREEIPLGARIIAIADAYDAMTSDRPYRPAFSQADAIAELKRCTGTQFDPFLVDLFLEILKKKPRPKLQLQSVPFFSPPPSSRLVH
ncbi:MAG: HD-GYP domain-containing protein [Firmicutes bacterium]|nr:HD-GYP domain-containing protein [Bacillota bacterium]